MLILIAMLATPAWFALLGAHKVGAAIACYLFLSCVVDALPPLTPDSPVAYRFVHALLNALAANGWRVLVSLVPRLAEVFPNGLKFRSKPTES